jgi:hypothetical protein
MKLICGLFVALYCISNAYVLEANQESNTVTITVPAIDSVQFSEPSVSVNFTTPSEIPTGALQNETSTSFDFFTNGAGKKVVAYLSSPLNDQNVDIEAQAIIGTGQGIASSTGWQILSTSPTTLIDNISQAHYLDSTLTYRVSLNPGTSTDISAASIILEVTNM